MPEAPADIVARHHRDPTRLVQILREVAAEAGHVPPAAITEIAAALGLPRGRVEGVAGFYAFLGTTPGGRTRIRFADDVTDAMRGAAALRQRMLDALGLRLGEVSADGAVDVGLTSCVGLCDQGPSLLADGRPIPRLDAARIGAICALLRAGVPVSRWPAEWFAIERRVGLAGRLLGFDAAPGEALAAAVALGPAGTRAAIEASGLRGRGGAGFPTGRKWAACAAAPGPERVVVCNADEGEPGTFKDRVLLAERADQVLEGLTVAAFAVGASRGFVYLRAEYPFLVPVLEDALARRRAAGLLGRDVAGVPGFSLEIALHLGAGAYVCGEETALLESLEGRRGIPRNRPPYPVTRGYLGRPTVVNNVETLLCAAWAVRYGPERFRELGTPASAGTKVLSVSGDVARPGVYEVPFGTPLREVLARAGAADPRAVQVGGPSGALLPAADADRRIAFEDVPCAGALVVFDDTRDLVEVVHHYARFFAHESCGFCTPCRVGTTLVADLAGRVAQGRGTRRDLADLARIARRMRGASHCGLPHTAGNPVLDALRSFEGDFLARVAATDDPPFDLDAALAPAREFTGRDDPAAHGEAE